MSDVGVHLWGDDAEAVEAAVAALHGHHPERGGQERAQAAFAVVRAVKPAVASRLLDALEDVFAEDKGFGEEEWLEWCDRVLPLMQEHGRLGGLRGRLGRLRADASATDAEVAELEARIPELEGRAEKAQRRLAEEGP